MSSSELAPDVPEEDGALALLGVRRRVGATLSKRWFRVALCVLGVATAPLIVFEAVRRGGLDALDTTAVLTVLAPCSFVVSGFIAWDRRPENRVGVLLMALGFLWTAGMLMQPPTTSSSLIYTIGIVWRLAWVAAFVFVLLSFPRGRLATLVDKLVAAAVFVVAVPLEIVWLLFLDSPVNAFLVWPSESIEDAVDTAQRVIFVGATLVLVAVLAKRWAAASRPLRRTLAPVVAGGVTVLGFSLFVIVEKFHPVPTYLWWDVFAAYTVVPVALLWSMLRARLARSSVGDLFVELRANPAPEHLRGALARALDDPSLELAFWLPEYETYADLDGRPIELPDDSGRGTTLVERDGAPLAALVHDASLREEPELLDAVCAAAGIALENAQLQSELRARLEELTGSRARILEAAQAERQRLERNLHDGAQQRLVSLSLELGMLGKRLDADAEAKQAVEQARAELTESLRELRELARGLHPAVVTDLGLEVALEGLRARASIPVRLKVDLDGRLPEAVEVAAYYLVCESLTNVAKYARASGATVDVAKTDGELVVEVVDDGVGGATTEGGSGLRGLADRVEALGGRLRVWSPAGGGTRVRAEIPCA